MRKLVLCVLILVLASCVSTARIKKVQDTDVCGSGDTHLLPSEGEVWLVLCEDGRVLWITDDDDDE